MQRILGMGWRGSVKNGFCAVLWITAAATAACGGEGSGRDDSGSGIGSISATDSASEGSGSNTESDSQGSNSQGSDSQSSSNTDATASAEGGMRFDIGLPPDGSLGCMENGGGGGGGGGSPDFSYIWIANSNEGTISKVNTQTLVEEGRYIARPDGAGNPSRTSVNLNGDVVVANRYGGLTMIAARPEDCPDPNNTSTGPQDVKPWPDGCVLWHTPFAYESQRPVAWSQGTFNEQTCRWENMKVWTSAHDGGTTTADVFRVSGEDGMIEDMVTVNGVQTHVYGIYGAAADANGNMWGSELSQGLLVNVDLATMALQTWPMPIAGYGMTVDHLGYVWVCANQVARFDPATQMWQSSAALSSGGNGCMEDGNGTLWVAAASFVGIDINTLAEVGTLALPARVRGVSFDFEGYIWGPSINSNEAYRVDPATGAVDTVTGFNYPYTYSDMTGFALSNAGTPDG
jgi:hypothetical protein